MSDKDTYSNTNDGGGLKKLFESQPSEKQSNGSTASSRRGDKQRKSWLRRMWTKGSSSQSRIAQQRRLSSCIPRKEEMKLISWGLRQRLFVQARMCRWPSSVRPVCVSFLGLLVTYLGIATSLKLIDSHVHGLAKVFHAVWWPVGSGVTVWCFAIPKCIRVRVLPFCRTFLCLFLGIGTLEREIPRIEKAKKETALFLGRLKF